LSVGKKTNKILQNIENMRQLLPNRAKWQTKQPYKRDGGGGGMGSAPLVLRSDEARMDRLGKTVAKSRWEMVDKNTGALATSLKRANSLRQGD
jgi:hypothetical protein